MTNTICLMLLAVVICNKVSAKSILVSFKSSDDVTGCGTEQLPCKTIPFAVSQALSKDIILIDGGNETQCTYTLKTAVQIDKEITIKAYNKSKHTPKIIGSSFLWGSSFFNASKSFVLDSLFLHMNFGPPLDGIMFRLLDSGVLTVNNCYILELKANDISNWQLNFNNCTFKRIIAYPPLQNRNLNLNIVNQGQTTLNILMKHCKIIDSKFMLEFSFPGVSQLIFKDTIFNNSILRENSMNLQIIDCKFFSSGINDAVMSSKILSGKTSKTKSSKRSWNDKNEEQAMLIVQNTYFNEASWHNDAYWHRVHYEPPIQISNKYIVFTNCIIENSSSGFLLAYSSTVIMYDTLIQNITQTYPASIVSVLHFVNTAFHTRNLTLVNNTAINGQGIITYVLPLKINLINVVVKLGKSLDVSKNLLNILTADQGMTDVFDGNTTLSCSSNHYIDVLISRRGKPKDNDFSILVTCYKCDGTKYNAAQGYTKWNTTSKTFDIFNVKCHECPYEAVCTNGIQSKGNYWGYLTDPSTVTFVRCPQGFCCSTIDTCLSYNTCAGNRTGRLCGKCLPCYSVSLFRHNQCTLDGTCIHSYFWVIYTFSCILYIAIFMYLKDFLRKLKSLTKKLAKRNHYEVLTIETESVVDNDLDIMCGSTSSNEESVKPMSNESKDEGVKISGLIKITFFFYQIASVVRINSTIKQRYNFPAIIDVLISFFNLKIDVASSIIDICPYAGSTTLTNEVIKSGLLFVGPLIIVLLIAFMCCIRRLKTFLKKNVQNRHDADSYDMIDDEVPLFTRLPFHIRLKCTYIQLLLIGYTSVSVLVFQLINCVTIQDEKYLFIQASIKCYNTWQIFIIIFVFIWLVPFCFSLFLSCQLLHQCKITPSQFLFSITFTPIAIYYWFKTTLQNGSTKLDKDDAMLAKQLLLVVNEPFRNSSRNKNRKIAWEPVLIFRRLIIVSLGTFVIFSLQKLYPIGMFLALCLLHHIKTKPYKNKHLNSIETVSLVMLCFLTLLNTFWAFTEELQIEKSNLLLVTGKVFLYIELIILLLPVVVAIVSLSINIVKALKCKRCIAKEE